MSYDLVQWNPRIGSSGDDIYNIPGSTKLDGTLDTDNPQTEIIACDVSGLSSTPKISEINLLNGYNQVIALYNRRMILGGSPGSTLSYIPSGLKLRNDFTTFQFVLNQIGTLITLEGGTSPSLSFPVVNPNTRIVAGAQLAYLRKCLIISGTYKLRLVAKYRQRIDNPYGTQTSIAINSFSGSSQALAELSGKGPDHAGVGPGLFRNRYLLQYYVPDFLYNISSAIITYGAYRDGAVADANEGYNVVLYSSNTDDSAFPISTGDHTDNIIDSNANTAFVSLALGQPGSATVKTKTLISTTLTSLANRYDSIGKNGGWLCFVIANDKEVAGTGYPGVGNPPSFSVYSVFGSDYTGQKLSVTV